MSADPSSLQCHRCAGFFQVSAAPDSRVRCPHCQWVASMGQFRLVQPGEVAPLPRQGVSSAEKGQGLAALWIEKGRHLQFGCPHCQRPMRMLREEAGGLTDCPHCGLEIVSPDPATGAGPRLSDASRRSLGNLADLKPRTARAGGSRAATDQLFEPVEPTGGESPFDPFGKSAEGASAGEVAPAKPVRTLGVKQLGSAFKARDDLAHPDPHAWEKGGAAAARPDESVPPDPRGKVFTLAGAILLLLLGGMFIVLELRRRGAESAGAAAPEVAAEPAVDPDHAAAFEVARGVLTADDWRELLPRVRSRARVEPLIAAYYRDRKLESFEPVSFENPVRIEAAGIDYLQLRVSDAEGEGRLVAFERTADGEFLFDWELWVDIAHLEWDAFVAERPSAPRVLRVTLARSSPLPRYVEDAGLAEGAARALRVWLDDSTVPLYAVLPESEDWADAVWQETSWELGRRVVAEVSFPSGAAEPDRVVVHRVLQGRWLRP